MDKLAAADAQTIKNLLDSGEQLLWTGRPDASRVAVPWIPAFLFAIPWIAASIFAVVMGIASALRGGESQVAFLFFALTGLFFVFLGLGLLSAPFIAYARAKKTRYAITNRRIMIVIAGANKIVQEHALSQLSNVRRYQYGSRADLSWTVQSSITVLRNLSASRHSPAGNYDVSLVGIEESSKVEKLVEDEIERIKEIKSL